MMYRFFILFFLSAILLSPMSAEALTCRVASTDGDVCTGSDQIAADCNNLGYFKYDVPDCNHYVVCPFDSSYKACVADKCTNYDLSACPENGVCVSCIYENTTKYALAGCESGYVVNYDGECSVAYASCEAANYFSDNINRVCGGDTVIYLTNATPTKCFTDCVCATGYVDVDGICEKTYTTCEDAGYHTIGTDATCASEAIIYTSDTDASQTATCCTEVPTCDEDNHVLDGNGNCVCAAGYVDVDDVCQKTYATCEDASYHTIGEHMVCEEDNEVSIYTSDTDSSKTASCCSTAPSCESGYVKNGDGACVKAYESCVAADKSYFENNTNRNCTGSSSIYLTDGTTKTCYIGCTCKTGYTTNSSTGNCEEAPCPSGSSTSTTCSGNAVAVANGSMSGTLACYSCNSCTTDYAVSAEYCRTSGSAGWTLGSSRDSVGCYNCVAKSCQEGSVLAACAIGQEKVETGYYSGDSICYKCEGEPTPITPVITCDDCPHGSICGGKCYVEGQEMPTDVPCTLCNQAPPTEIGDDPDPSTPNPSTPNPGSSSGGGGGGGVSTLPSGCQLGYDYCKIDPLHKCCSKQENDAAASVQ